MNTLNGYSKSTLTDKYVLTAAGGHLAVATAGTTKPWNSLVSIGTDGVSEIGRYIDFHHDNTTGSDYSTRLQSGGNYSNVITLPSSSGTLALTSQIPTITNYYWANVPISATSSSTTTPIFGNVRIGGTKTLSSAWKNGLVVGPDDYDKVVMTYLASSTNGATVGAHNSALSAWAPLHLLGTKIHFRISESLKMELTTSGLLAILKAGASANSGLVVGADSTKSNISTSIADQTSMILIVAGAGGNANSTAIGFHNPGISSAVLEYRNTAAEVGYFKFRSDDKTWGVSINNTGNPQGLLDVNGDIYVNPYIRFVNNLRYCGYFSGGKYLELFNGVGGNGIHIFDDGSIKTYRESKTYILIDSGNYNSYSPTLTGTGASGTWGINITGNAASATKVYVNLHTTNDVEYPLVWSNQTDTTSAQSNLLYKSYSYLTYNPKNNRITASTFKGSLQGNIKPYALETATSGKTVKNIKDALVTLFNNIGEGIGANVTISASVINLWNSESASLYATNVYSVIKIGGGYSGTTYGQWLLSTYASNRIGYVGRDANAWGNIYWIATTEDINNTNNKFANYLPLTGGTMKGIINMGAYDLQFKGSDPGDLCWFDASGNETHRLYYNSVSGLAYRFKAGTTYTMLHSGNYSTYLDSRYYTETEVNNKLAGYLPLSGGTMTGNIKVYTDGDGRGLKFGTSVLNSLSNQLLWQSAEAIRFGSSSWDWNAWAGLKYNHSSKIIYLGLADGTVFNANSGLSGGKLYLPGISNIYTGNGTNLVWHAGNDGSGSGLDADTLDGYHEYSFLRLRATTSTNGENTLWSLIGIKSYHNALPDGLSGLYTYGEVVSLAGNGMRLDIFSNHNGSENTVEQGLWWRSGWNDDKKAWRRIIDSGNIANLSVNYASSAGSVAWGNVTGKPTEFNPISHTHSYITSGGRLTCGTTTARATGLRLYEIYNNGYPFTYGNVILFNGASGVGLIACQWHGTGLAYRSAPDTSTTFTGWATILTSTNSSVSGGGSSWGSSITVKINDTTATLTIPSNPNTWRPITNSYSGTVTTTSLSQKGANDLYNAVIGSIPTVNNGKITIKLNGTEIGSFTMNQSSAGTINLTDTTYSLVGANGTTGLIKNGSTVTNATGYIACPIINGVPYYQNTILGNSGVTAGTYTPTPSSLTNSTHQSIKVPELTINAQGLITKAYLKNVSITGSFYIVSNKTLTNSDLSFITSIAIAPGYTVTFPTPSASNEGKIIFVKAAYGNTARYVSGKIAACNSICSTASTTTIDIGYHSRIFVCMDYGSGYAWVDYYCG